MKYLRCHVMVKLLEFIAISQRPFVTSSNKPVIPPYLSIPPNIRSFTVMFIVVLSFLRIVCTIMLSSPLNLSNPVRLFCMYRNGGTCIAHNLTS